MPASQAGVTVTKLLDDSDGCRGLHQRRVTLAGGAVLSGSADGFGESWYVVRGAGHLAGQTAISLWPDTAVWMKPGTPYRLRAGEPMEVVATTVRAGSPGGGTGPATHVVALADCAPERTGDREFRVLLSAGLTFTQFVGMIPPGRAPAHHHTYDEVVHVLTGHGVAHLPSGDAAIGPGTSIYLPPYTEHCLENTGTELLRVLGVFHPAGSPAAKREA